MPVYLLTDEIAFPPPTHAESDGLLAVGGDLGAERLLLAYEIGVFPWYTEGQPILWWSPDPRIIFEPAQFSLSRRLRQKLRQKKFEVTFDRAFSEVIRACATVAREGQQGTWITGEMINAYTRLHEMGFAHSVESWLDGRLAGGIYGVSLGRCFFGESMFFRETDASKVALDGLLSLLREWNFDFLDAQVPNPHLLRLGGKVVPRAEFLRRLKQALRYPTRRGKWDAHGPL